MSIKNAIVTNEKAIFDQSNVPTKAKVLDSMVRGYLTSIQSLGMIGVQSNGSTRSLCSFLSAIADLGALALEMLSTTEDTSDCLLTFRALHQGVQPFKSEPESHQSYCVSQPR